MTVFIPIAKLNWMPNGRPGGVLGADMETAALMVVGALRGLRTASLLNVVVAHSGCLESSINHYVQQETLCQQGEERQISLALQAIYFDSLQGEQ